MYSQRLPCPLSRVRARSFLLCSALLVLAGVVCGQNPPALIAGSKAPRSHDTPPLRLKKIQHIVFIIKENRSFDHYFGKFPGADGAKTGLISDGQRISLWRAPDILSHDVDHTFEGAINGEDGGKMDRFDLNNSANVNGDFEAYTQMTEEDIPNYWSYAQHFVLADHMFQSTNGPSLPNHL